jgi:hypothetical protein
MVKTDDSIVDAYLETLEGELRDLPRDKRREILEEIREHIEQARWHQPPRNDAELRELLERMGDPSEIAAEARDRFGIRVKRPGAMEMLTVVLLLVGGIVLPVLGWIVGVVLLWISETWTDREKLIGTLVVPGGLAPAFFLAFFAAPSRSCVEVNGTAGHLMTCTPGPSVLSQILWTVGWLILLVAPVATTVYLSRQLRRRQRTTLSLPA